MRSEDCAARAASVGIAATAAFIAGLPPVSAREPPVQVISGPEVDDRWAAILKQVSLGVLALNVRLPSKPDGSAREHAGSAFAISGSPDAYYVITAAHVLPTNATGSSIEAMSWPPFVRKRGPVALSVKSVERGQLTDLAVMVPAVAGGLAYATLSTRAIEPVVGVELAILGHPNGEASAFVPARIAGEGPDGTLKLTGIVEEGYSGAPVFDKDGHVVCVVRGGDPVAEVPKNKKVMGKALCTPIQQLLRRWSFAPFEDGPPPTAISAPPPPRTLNLPDEQKQARLTLVRTVEVTKDDHPVLLGTHSRRYRETVTAPAGYRVVDAEFTPWSATRAKYSIERNDKEAVLAFELTSGPAVDRYRGWLKGKFAVIVASDK